MPIMALIESTIIASIINVNHGINRKYYLMKNPQPSSQILDAKPYRQLPPIVLKSNSNEYLSRR